MFPPDHHEHQEPDSTSRSQHPTLDLAALRTRFAREVLLPILRQRRRPWLRRICGSSGPAVLTMDEHRGEVTSMAVFPDGRVVSGSGDGTVTVWDPQTGVVRKMDQHQGWFTSVAVLSDGHVVLGSSDGTVKVWDPETGVAITQDQNRRGVTHVAVFPDGRVVSSSNDGTVTVWGVGLSRIVCEYRTAVIPTALAISPTDNGIVVGLSNGHLMILALEEYQ